MNCAGQYQMKGCYLKDFSTFARFITVEKVLDDTIRISKISVYGDDFCKLLKIGLNFSQLLVYISFCFFFIFFLLNLKSKGSKRILHFLSILHKSSH